MSWRYDMIEAERRKLVEERYAQAERDELISRIVELETQLSPFRTALSPILDKSWRGTHATSKLWPLRPDGDEDLFYVYNNETKKADAIPLSEDKLAETEYYTADSITIDDGLKLGDDFEIIAFHQEAPGCYIGNGDITVSDVRRLVDVLARPYRKT